MEMSEGRGTDGLPHDLRILVQPETPRSLEEFIPLEERSVTATIVALTIGIPALVGAIGVGIQGGEHAYLLAWTTAVAFAVAFADVARRSSEAKQRAQRRWPWGLYRVGDQLFWFSRCGSWLHAPLALARIDVWRYSREQGPSGVAPALYVARPGGERYLRIDLGVGSRADARAEQVARWLGLERLPVRSGPV